MNRQRRSRFLVHLPALQPRLARAARLALLAALGALALPAASTAQDLYPWTVGVLGGVGGSEDVKPGSHSFDNGTFQVEGLYLTEPRTLLGLRVGRLDLGGSNQVFGSRVGADLNYVTLAGQYMLEEPYYDSGIYLGLGAYSLGGKNLAGGTSASTTAAGAVLGFTGEFKATRRFSVLVELSAHYITVRDSHIFGMAHGGLAFHF